MPMVSVIVPVYKVEKYLPACIESILSQSFEDFELILVDDGSPDRCGAICDEYAQKDQRIRVIHKENGGVSAARNRGLEESVGQYIAFCDSDDYWSENFLETLVNKMESTGCDIVNGNYIMVADDDTEVGKSRIPQGEILISSKQEKFDFLVKNILSGTWGWSIWTRLFKREIIQRNNIRFCTVCENYAEDLGFVFQYCLYINRAVSITDPIYYYRAREGSMMANSKRVLKLEAMNNLSRCLKEEYDQVFTGFSANHRYPIIHFLVMCPEYRKIACTPDYCTMGIHSKKITKKLWYKLQLLRLFTCMPELKRIFGKTNARRVLLLANYARHGCWKRFIIESAITYKWLVKI